MWRGSSTARAARAGAGFASPTLTAHHTCTGKLNISYNCIDRHLQRNRKKV
jgi:hypothetical protein